MTGQLEGKRGLVMGVANGDQLPGELQNLCRMRGRVSIYLPR